MVSEPHQDFFLQLTMFHLSNQGNQDPSSSPINSTATNTIHTNPNSMDSIISLNLPIAIKLNESNFLT
jgi:hypothetical protein